MRDPMSQWPLTILNLSSDPRDVDRWCLAQELQVAIRGTRSASSLIIVNEELPWRYLDITAVLDRSDPHILHFSERGEEDLLHSGDVYRTAYAVQKQALARALRH